MTPNQWRLLEILDTWGGHGTTEVEIQWGDYELPNDPEGLKGFLTTRLVVSSLMRTLVRRGYATMQESYDITDKGREVLAARRRK